MDIFAVLQVARTTVTLCPRFSALLDPSPAFHAVPCLQWRDGPMPPLAVPPPPPGMSPFGPRDGPPMASPFAPRDGPPQQLPPPGHFHGASPHHPRDMMSPHDGWRGPR